jgi:hypothetical protein
VCVCERGRERSRSSAACTRQGRWTEGEPNPSCKLPSLFRDPSPLTSTPVQDASRGQPLLVPPAALRPRGRPLIGGGPCGGGRGGPRARGGGPAPGPPCSSCCSSKSACMDGLLLRLAPGCFCKRLALVGHHGLAVQAAVDVAASPAGVRGEQWGWCGSLKVFAQEGRSERGGC